MSEDWEARANRAEALLREVMEFCEDVFANPAAHVPPWGRQASTVEGRHATREQHLAARISSIIENAGKGPAFVAMKVDPPDVAHEDDHPVYRVNLWRQQAALPEIPQDQMKWELDSYDVTVVDVPEVLDWANWRVQLVPGPQKPPGPTRWPGPTRVWIGIVIGQGDDRTLIRLAGTEPTRQ
ncbi:hypothetical protein [Actinopolymorpha pittospori]|uniref:Uncharacterized protein n=1 Tax=Actinopolymorpha pittospori TaxID=648752 RepID=A0A927RJN9_9ACTN|nr:hypothetical protein [Actinopolymorpha pittospori]MBE1605853.1 hypothetical protein [Actinopolymorpha pittospori]